MKKFIGFWLLILCWLAGGPLSCAWSQGDAASDRVPERRNRSHFPLPSDGAGVDPSKFLPEHFARASKSSQALSLYRHVLNNPLDYLKEENQSALRQIAES